MKKILVPIDFSDVSKHALAFADQLAEVEAAEVVVLHSIDISLVHQDYFVQFSIDDYIHQLLERTQKQLDETILELTGKKLRTLIETGGFVDVLKNSYKEENPDLVVMGTQGSSGLAEFFIGSNTEKVVRTLGCPVISVPQPVDFKKIKKILVPIDLHEIQATFLHHVQQLQLYTESKLEFIWVKTPHTIENEEKVMEEVTTLLKKHGLSSFTFSIVNAFFPFDGILEYAASSQSDLVAMPTHARRGLSHLLSGSLTEDTVNHIDIPVWTFKLDKEEESLSLQSVSSEDGFPSSASMVIL